MMQHSAELRWFFLGATPSAAKKWFGAGDEPKKLRTDQYLMFPGCRTLGVKLRQGKLEIKTLTTGPTLLRPAPGVVGRTDSWVKWSIELPIDDALNMTMKKGVRWITLSKTRWLRTYSIDGGDRAVQVDRNERPHQGCSVELTELANQDQGPDDRWQWWTIGFEAFGPAARVEGNLRVGLAEFFVEAGAPVAWQMLEANSMSYPVWFEAVGLI